MAEAIVSLRNVTKTFPGGVSAMSSLPMMIPPDVGVSRPEIMRSSVVLPQPDGPTSISNSPMRASKFTSFNTSVRASPWPKALQTVLVLTPSSFIPSLFCLRGDS